MPNVVYTCGALVHNGELIIPYGLADHATGFATVPLAEVLAAMEQEASITSMTIPNKRVAVLSPVAWRTPPRQYGAWETVAGNIAEGLVARGWDVTLFATRDSVTRAHLHAVVDRGYEEDPAIDPKVAEYLHISEAFEHAAEFDLIHSHYDFMALSYTRSGEDAGPHDHPRILVSPNHARVSRSIGTDTLFPSATPIARRG